MPTTILLQNGEKALNSGRKYTTSPFQTKDAEKYIIDKIYKLEISSYARKMKKAKSKV
jgi:hypothetical protein